MGSGARVVAQLQSRVEVHSPRRRRVSVSALVTCAACDVAIANAAEPLQEQPALRAMLEQVGCASLSRKPPNIQGLGSP